VDDILFIIIIIIIIQQSQSRSGVGQVTGIAALNFHGHFTHGTCKYLISS
jgi:hypothetical protein